MSDKQDPIVTKQDIVNGLHRLNVNEGDVILVHSSLGSFGYVEGGADTVIDALLETIGPEGTVMVPTITATANQNVDNPPIFDVRNTPSWTGKIPEVFRKRPNAIRSLHPTHSVAAIGKLAKYLTKDHINSPTPCGQNSPYMRLIELNGKVVFLGVTLKSCTLFHTIEEIADLPYHLQKTPVTAKIIDTKGNVIEKTMYIHLWGRERDFEKLEPKLLEKGFMKIGKIGNADIRVLDAKPTVEFILDLLGTCEMQF